MKANNENKSNLKVNESANVATNAATPQVEPQVEPAAATATATPATDEKEAQEKEAQRKKAIAAKVAEIKKTTKEIHEKRDVTDFLDTSDKGIAATTATKFQTLGKFHGKFQAIRDKDGGKTVYIFESEKDIYIGFTSSELSDIFKLEKRQYKKNESESATDSPYLAELKQLQKAIEKVTTDECKNFVLSFSEELKAKIEKVTTKEKEKAQFESTFAAVIPLFTMITEKTFSTLYKEENLKIALALGYKFSDTPADTKGTKEQEQEQEQEQGK